MGTKFCLALLVLGAALPAYAQDKLTEGYADDRGSQALVVRRELLPCDGDA